MNTKTFPERVTALLSCLLISFTLTACSSAGRSIEDKSQADVDKSNETSETQSTESEDNSMDTENMKLVWSDEFDGPDGSSVNPDNWVIEKGNNGGWGNDELQYYTGSTGNCSVQDGSLVIKAIKEEKEGFQYTSARIKTKGKFEFKYGKIEMKAKLPQGMGIWPAFWMLGTDIDSVNWPNCGEIDIMEFIGREPGIIHGTLHGPEYHGDWGISKKITAEEDLHDIYHTYSVEWDEASIKWYFDDVLYHQLEKEKFPTTYTWVYDKEFFILINLAVGGKWPRNPDETTEFPQSYSIDYVRVYQK